MKARVLQLVDDLSLGLAASDMADFYYDQVIYDFGLAELFTTSTLVTASDGTASYTIPTTAIRRLQVFWDTQELDMLTLEEAESVFGMAWRDMVGPPEAYVVEREADRTLRLVPQPDVSSKDFSFAFGLPFGLDFPEYSIVMTHTEFQEDVSVLFDLPIAFFIMTKEFLRESDHQDEPFARACQTIGTVLMNIAMKGIRLRATAQLTGRTR